MTTTSLSIDLSQADETTSPDGTTASCFGHADDRAVALSGEVHATAIGISQSDLDSSTGDAQAVSAGIGTGTAIAGSGDASAIGLGIGQSDADSANGNGTAASIGIGAAAAASAHGDATSVGVGIGQSDVDAPAGDGHASSLGTGSAVSVAQNGAADATGMGIAQTSVQDAAGHSEDMALGLGQAHADGAGSFAYASGTGQIVDNGDAKAGMHDAFGASDPSELGAALGDRALAGILARFEARAEHLMDRAHEAALDGDDRSFERDFSVGGHSSRGPHGEGSIEFTSHGLIDPETGDALGDVSFTFSEEVTLPDGRIVSLSFAYAEQDDLTTGKSQIATAFSMAEGARASTYASADAGYAHAQTEMSGIENMGADHALDGLHFV